MSFTKSRAFSVIYMFVISAVFAGVLTGIRTGTADRVADNEKTARNRNLVEVFELIETGPDTTGQALEKAVEKNVQQLWVVEKESGPVIVQEQPADSDNVVYCMWALVDSDKKPRAYAFPVGGSGFWGPIEGIMSVDTDFETIRTVVWTRQTETPGLGARIEEDAYREKFRGKKAPDPEEQRFEVVPEGTMGDDAYKVDQISGATQTTVVGMGRFLNDNFAKWHRYRPLVESYFNRRD